MSQDLRIVCIADTHELHRELDVPDGDILIHAGDFTMFSRSRAAILDFNDWLGELPHRHKILVPGNHEFFLEQDPSRCHLISNAMLLVNKGVQIEGLKMWGSPVTPLYGGAFGLSSAADRAALYARIPDDVDVLVTHGPPYGILDGGQRGDRELLNAIWRLRPKLHVFGHIHGANGMASAGNTLFVNAALLGIGGGLEAPPVMLRMPRI